MNTMHDGHKHDLKIKGGIACCTLCEKNVTEIRNAEHQSGGIQVSAPPQPTAPTDSPKPPPLTFTSTNVSGHLTAGLGSGLNPISITVNVTNDPTLPMGIKVQILGQWDGRWLRGAIREIEREYRKIKHDMTRILVQKAAQEKFRTEALKTTVINK